VKHPAAQIPAGTFASILRQAGLSRAEFDRLV
jgi:predicted RNA binding protein YcfA (HicA-like mRNA interferase family)